MLLLVLFVSLWPVLCITFHLHSSFKKGSSMAMINIKNLFDRNSPKAVVVGKITIVDSELVKKNILQECDEHMLKLNPSYTNHIAKIEQLSSSAAKSNVECIVIPSKKYSLYHISSAEDENEDENKNINDTFWKLCVKYGEGTMACTNEFGTSFQFSINFAGFFEVRYIYRKSEAKQDQNVNVYPITFVDFQWYLFGFKVYNRLINRKEMWNLRFRDDDTTVVYITNASGEEKQYDRLAVFRCV